MSYISHRQEYKADAFAANYLRSKGIDPVEAAKKVLSDNGTSFSHPATLLRLAAIM